MYSPRERFLLRFHGEQPGVSDAVFSGQPVVMGDRQFASSYVALLEAVPDSVRRILDLACGNAPLYRLFRQGRPRTVYLGADLSLDELRLAPPTAWRLAARAQSLPLPDASVDAVASHMALMLMDDAPRVVGEVARVLCEGGAFVGVLPAARPPSPAFDAYVQLLLREFATLPAPPAGGASGAAWRDEASIEATLSPHFGEFRFDLLECRERLTPLAAWDSFMAMYDLHHLGEAARASIRAEWLAQVRAGDWLDAAGCLTLTWQKRRFRCTRCP